jgi:hypothetical protein
VRTTATLPRQVRGVAGPWFFVLDTVEVHLPRRTPLAAIGSAVLRRIA